jgi:hypothetical protein
MRQNEVILSGELGSCRGLKLSEDREGNSCTGDKERREMSGGRK